MCLHKIVSNDSNVMTNFSSEDLVKDLMSLGLTKDALPIQRSLGISWELKSDSVTFRITPDEKPFTRRGLLSTLNSFYGPLGLAALILIRSKLLLGKMNAATNDWGQILPKDEWTTWKQHMQSLESLCIPRQYTSLSFIGSTRREVHLFTDASEVTDADGNQQQGCLLGKAKVALNIPHLELCAAVLDIEIASIIKKQMDIPIGDFHFYTDSRVVRNTSAPEQWSYIRSEYNPADEATSSSSNRTLTHSTWLKGPTRWFNKCSEPDDTTDSMLASEGHDYQLVDSESDKEIRPVISVNKVIVHQPTLASGFKNYSTWKSLVGGIVYLKHIARSWSGESSCTGWYICTKSKDINLLKETKKIDHQ